MQLSEMSRTQANESALSKLLGFPAFEDEFENATPLVGAMATKVWKDCGTGAPCNTMWASNCC